MIQNACYLNRSFKNSRSLCQGDPITSYLYILCPELFSIVLRSKHDIKLININDVINPLKWYTDVTCIKIEEIVNP